MYNVLFTIFFISIVLLIIFKINKDKFDRNILIFLYIYHIIFAYAYYVMSLNGSADAHMYYYSVYDNLDTFNFIWDSTGTLLIQNLTFLTIKYLNLNYLNVTLLFATTGYFGFYILYKLVFTRIDHKYIIILLFIPGLHFWTVAIGKDSLIFFAISLLIYALVKKRILYGILALIFIYVIREYILIMFIVSGSITLIYLFIRLNISIVFKFFFLVVLSILSLYVLNYISSLYLGSNYFSIELLWEYIQKRQTYNLAGGSSVDISNYNIFMQIFTFLFRPFFESLSIKYLIVSFENLIYLFLTIYFVINIRYVQINKVNIFMIFFSLIFILLFSLTTTNLGLAIRMKVMIIPIFFYLLFTIYERKRL